MNQFSDLLGIKLSIRVAITLEPVVENGAPCVKLFCNDKVLVDDQLMQQQTWIDEIGLMDLIDIQIQLSGKEYSAERETAVIIKSIMIDEFGVIPQWTHLATYQNEEHNNDATSYLGFNGLWQFRINEPFYRWHHRTTGQGWLLEPTEGFRDCVPSSSNTTTMQVRNGVGNKIPTIDPKPDEPNEPAVR